ncbi:MAG: hypothetical protein ACREXS_19005 [Gammaproteobacteria bacterium]
MARGNKNNVLGLFYTFSAKALAARLSVLLLLAFATTALRSDPPPNSANPDFIHALWVVKVDRIAKIAAADGKTLLEVTDARKPKAATIDEVQGVVWVLAKGLLKAYAFNGELRLSVPVPSPNDDDGEADDRSDGDHKGDDALAVNPVNGSVWLAIDKDLHHLDGQGQLLESLALPHHVRGMVLDQSTERLWVATKKSVTAFEDDGTTVSVLVDLGPNPDVQDIDVDPDLHYLWVALKKQLRRHDLANGALQTSRSIKKLV